MLRITVWLVAVYLAVAMAAVKAQTTVEAEDLSLSGGYEIETVGQSSQPIDDASGGAVIWINPTNGEGTTANATYQIAVTSGDYKLDMFWYDENDGQATINVYDNEIAQGGFTLDLDDWNRRQLTIAALNLTNGENLRFECTSNAGEWCRFDSFTLTSLTIDGPEAGEVDIDLTWNANAAGDNVTGYSVYYGASGSATTLKEDLGNVTSVTYDANDFLPNWDDVLCFALKARNSCDVSGQFTVCYSPFSVEDCVTIVEEP